MKTGCIEKTEQERITEPGLVFGMKTGFSIGVTLYQHVGVFSRKDQVLEEVSKGIKQNAFDL